VIQKVIAGRDPVKQRPHIQAIIDSSGVPLVRIHIVIVGDRGMKRLSKWLYSRWWGLDMHEFFELSEANIANDALNSNPNLSYRVNPHVQASVDSR
jgi:hypothetical protein